MKKDKDNIEDEEIEDENQDGFQNEVEKHIDNLQKENIDNKRIKIIDKSKKRAVVESVLDERTLFSLKKITTNGPLNEIVGIINSGKESNVYLAYDNDGKEVAVKIYKIDSNTSKWMRNYIIGDPRFKNVPRNISKVIYMWAGKEFKNLKRAFKSGVRVPKPLFVTGNILGMEYIGFGTVPAPKLKDLKEISNIDELFKEILHFIKILYQNAKLVHGDLSEFNILYHNQKPVIIDISQAVSTQHPKAEVYLSRDIKNIFHFFEQFGVDLPDPSDFYDEVVHPE